MHTICNPMNLPYQYQHYGHPAHREAADPTLVLFKGVYYLFPSMTGGFFYSYDMIDWEYHQYPDLEMYHYAPDVHVIDDRLVFCSSSHQPPCAFWVTDDPFSDHWEKVSETFAFWDPALFQDDDGRVYLYWGCDCGVPLYAQELDRTTLQPIGEKKAILSGQPDQIGFERRQYPTRPKEKAAFFEPFLNVRSKLKGGAGANEPFIEGSFMNKWNGKYYLQYAGPATEVATYSDGVYVSDSPLGPFTMQQHNPFSSNPSGFMTGAGHGSTIEDIYGNLWHCSTMRISVNANFERRIGLFPAGLDEDGILFCNQNFADYPVRIPEGKFDPNSIHPEWMLLSYAKPATASSSLEGHDPSLAFNEDCRTWWCAENSAGEWLQVDLGESRKIYSVQVNLADENVPELEVSKDVRERGRYIDLDIHRRVRWTLEASEDGVHWAMLIDKSEAETDLADDYIELPAPVRVRYLRLTSVELPYGEKFAVSGLRVFGESDTPAPAQASMVRVRMGGIGRSRAAKEDLMTATLRWNPSEHAHGYNIRYGIAPDKLYLSHRVFGVNEATLTTLNVGSPYYVAVDAFGEGGITEGKVYRIR